MVSPTVSDWRTRGSAADLKAGSDCEADSTHLASASSEREPEQTNRYPESVKVAGASELNYCLAPLHRERGRGRGVKRYTECGVIRTADSAAGFNSLVWPHLSTAQWGEYVMNSILQALAVHLYIHVFALP